MESKPRIQVLREVYETPESVTELLSKAGGLNPYGKPMYRAVWGWNRLTLIGGKWEDRDEQGMVVREVVELRQEPKYPQVNRWHIEKWLPAEMYGSPEMWWGATIEYSDGTNSNVPALGPYPAQGEYEHCLTLEGTNGEFIPLTITAAERIALTIERSRYLAKQAATHARAREEKKDDATEARDYDILDDAVGAFHEMPFVTVTK